ncbi:MAG: peroxiredoxin [Burkholderiales bacterium]
MAQIENSFALPANLPAPRDDGACDHLTGMRLPSLTLPATDGERIDLSTLTGTTVLYCYPLTGRPGRELPPGWDEIPGARGCTPQTCAFRDHHQELKKLGARVFGLSAQSTEYQQEAAQRLHLPFALLSDEKLDFARALRLPVFAVEGMTLIKRLTLIIRGMLIINTFYPVFPPDENAGAVLQWLEKNPQQ